MGELRLRIGMEGFEMKGYVNSILYNLIRVYGVEHVIRVVIVTLEKFLEITDDAQARILVVKLKEVVREVYDV